MLSPKIINFFYWKGGSMKIPMLYGESPKTDKKLKIIIFSHGLGAYRSLYSTILGDLASRGYIVASLEHRDESSCYTYYYNSKEDAENDRRTAISYKLIKLGQGHLESRTKQVQYRAEECSKVLDFLINLNNGLVPYNVMSDTRNNHQIDFKLEDLVGKLDVESITMCGHSFGGATALLTMSKRSELKQGIILDPWMFPIKNEEIYNNFNQKLLFINTQTFHIKSNVDSMEKYLGENAKMYTILRTTHENHGDTLFWSGYWLNWFMKKINPITALYINNSLMLRFLKETTRNDCDIKDCEELLNRESNKYVEGLTKAWA
nr:platelet-activating factor acetylhydrolase-like [Onthophagus taurus]